MHKCVSKLTIIGSDNGLLPGPRQAIVWTNAWLLLTGPLGTNFNEILIKIHIFLFKKMHLKMASVKWRPYCASVNVLIETRMTISMTYMYQQASMHWCRYDIFTVAFCLFSLSVTKLQIIMATPLQKSICYKMICDCQGKSLLSITTIAFCLFYFLSSLLVNNEFSCCIIEVLSTIFHRQSKTMNETIAVSYNFWNIMGHFYASCWCLGVTRSFSAVILIM